MSSTAKHRLIAAGFRLIAATAADRWLAPTARGRGAILMFHHVRPPRQDSFQPNALLEITPDHLERTLGIVRDQGYEIVSLDEVPQRLTSGGRPFVALTFDDGYRDNRDYALPILRRHGAPWTMFVTADYASGQGRLWWLELEEVIRASEMLEVPGRTLPARTEAEKMAAFGEAYRVLRAGPEEALRDSIARWCEQAGIDPGLLVRRLCLDWSELAELRREPGLAFGAHTLTHPMLAKHPEATARAELHASRAMLADRLGQEVRHVAYPVGDRASAGAREFRLAREAGFATGLTTRPGHLFPEHAEHLHALPRVSVNGLYQSEAAIRALLSGVPFLLWNRGRRLDVG